MKQEKKVGGFMKEIITNIMVGMLPEVIFFTLFLIYTKDLKTKRKFLFLGILVSYILCIMIRQYIIMYYLIFILSIWLIEKIVYRENTDAIDIFVFTVATVYLSFVGFICSRFLSKDMHNYYFILVFNRIALFIPFIFRSQFHNLYLKYKKFWNRNDAEKRNLKSISLRNISLIGLNIFIFSINIFLINISNYINGGD